MWRIRSIIPFWLPTYFYCSELWFSNNWIKTLKTSWYSPPTPSPRHTHQLSFGISIIQWVRTPTVVRLPVFIPRPPLINCVVLGRSLDLVLSFSFPICKNLQKTSNLIRQTPRHYSCTNILRNFKWLGLDIFFERGFDNSFYLRGLQWGVNEIMLVNH